ncbi:hypothetical protein [Parasitella parasitica]|uniref:NodB homology domain-containing protein n=1 Tax=Parasitella parasitica TaxID=35722 RepID=A0A0B7NNI8_9FUNG|nr:hypothetical protein [Parasitella parasitica]
MFIAGFGTLLLATGTFVSAATTTSSTKKATSTTASILAVESPTWLPNFTVSQDVNSGYPTGKLNTSSTLSQETLDLSAYPDPWSSPSTTSEEVKAVIAAIDWTKVPKAPVHKTTSAGDIDMSGYDDSKDDYCWWSSTNCVKPKASYLPQDISYCPNAGDWGLNYDDGPFNLAGEEALDKWAEPELYNYLAKTNDQKATLFYIGSNVATYPAAAVRALNNGHVLCVHTWSHPQMTTQSNEKVVAELYWTLRAIKEATGITTKCWRPPYGDVDDRVRAIAWQMGLHTILWDEDTNDWNMPGEGGGSLSPKTVDGYFEGWIKARESGKDKEHGHIILEHELNNSTVNMTEHWLPQLQKTFNVVTIQQCMNVSQPYWETNWQYPTEENPLVGNTTTTSLSAISSSTSVAAIAATTADAAAVEATSSNAAETTNVRLAAIAETPQSNANSLKASSFMIAILAAAYFF